MYQISFNFTLTADLTAVKALRCSHLKANLKSSFLIHIFVFGNFVRSATMQWIRPRNTNVHIQGSNLLLFTHELTDFSLDFPGKDKSWVTLFLGTNFPLSVIPGTQPRP